MVTETRPTHTELVLFLRLRGWFGHGNEWRHRGVTGVWPFADALRLQDETDGGMQDAACNSLRGAQLEA